MQTLLLAPPSPRFVYVLAHGAGAGMTHPFLESLAQLLKDRGVATLRYNFAYMESGSKRPDAPAVAHARVVEACAAAAQAFPGLPVIAGGKSFGGRMTSQALAAGLLPDVRGVAFVGFPLHPPDKPGLERAEHLDGVRVPLLFLQGTRDEFAQLPLLEQVVARLGERATLRLWEQADHSFHQPARITGKKDAQVLAEVGDALVAWAQGVLT